MSKPNISKGNPSTQSSNGSKGALNRPGARPAVPPPPATKKNGVAARPGYGNGSAQAGTKPMRNATGRAVQAPAKRKGGFRLRPLDIGLILAGILVVGFIVLSALQAPVQSVDPNAQLTGDGTPLAMGSAAPDFTLPGLDGQSYTLSSFKGKPVLLEFIATWCPHCREEAPTIAQLDGAYKSKGVQILAVNSTPYGHTYEDTGSKSPATMDDLKWYHDNYNVTYPLLFDKELKVPNSYQVVSYPTIYIVDRSGNIAFQPPTDNIPDYNTLSSTLDKLLASN